MSHQEQFEPLAERMKRMQLRAQENARKRNPAAVLRRGFHAKGTGVRAQFQIRADIPRSLQVGLFQPKATYEALVRFSNARSEVLSDLSKDQRGIAIRLKTIPHENLSPTDNQDIQDFLMTNTPVSFARSPLQFIEVGEILLDGIGSVAPKLIQKYGLKETVRILKVFMAPVISFKPYQMNQYWSRTSFKFGDQAVRFLIRPAKGSKEWSVPRQLIGAMRSLGQGEERRENYLRWNLIDSLKAEEACFDFCVQLFVDDRRTPIEDAYIEWEESDSPPIEIATLTIPRQGFDEALQHDMEFMAFNPWNTAYYMPLGLINLARKKVYEASAIQRGASPKSAGMD